LHRRHDRGEEPPGEQKAGDPFPGTEPEHAGVAGDLEQCIPDEENSGAQPVGGRGQADVLAHRQLRETNVVPVQEGNEIQEDDERQHPPLDLADGAITQFTQ